MVVSDVKEIVIRGVAAASDADSRVRNAVFDLSDSQKNGKMRALA